MKAADRLLALVGERQTTISEVLAGADKFLLLADAKLLLANVWRCYQMVGNPIQ
jgi:hypothetical protein